MYIKNQFKPFFDKAIPNVENMSFIPNKYLLIHIFSILYVDGIFRVNL